MSTLANQKQIKPLTLDFYLHKKQRFALFSRATEILYGGAAGGGKSHLMRVAAILWACQVPGLQIYIFRRHFDELYKNHMEGPSSFPELLSEWVNAKLVSINHSSHTIRFWNGSTIFLCHCQHEKDVYKYKGPEIHVLMIDELTQFTAKMYRFLRSRMRLGGLVIPPKFAGLFPRALNGTNPGDIGHNWVKADFVDCGPEGSIQEMPNAEGGMQRQYVRALLADNPSVDADDYAGKLEGLGDEALVRAMLDGDWDIVAGGMFDDIWRRDVHVIKPFAIPASWAIDRSFDWGSSAPFSVGWWAESDGTAAPNGKHYPPGTLFRINEWYGWNGRPNEGLKMLATEIAKGIKEREAKMGITVKPGPADSSIFDAENGVCIADDMAKFGVKWTAADKSPGSRKTGWERMRKYLKASIPARDANGNPLPLEQPGLFVFEQCAQFIRTVPVLPRDQNRRDDVDTKAEDHIGDEARYRVMTPRKKWSVA